MKKNLSFKFLFLFCLSLALTSPVQSAVELSNTGAEYRFGQVKALSRPLSWRKLTTPHFEIFFYQGLEELAQRSARILEEEAFGRVFPDFRSLYTLTPYRKIRVILFASRKEYQNSQASGLSLTDTSEGVAHILINRLVVIGQPTFRDLRGVLTHEITHLITIGPFRNNLLYGVTDGVPGWIAEGLAEYYMPAETRFPNREVALRDVVLRDEVDKLSTISTVSGNLHYAEAWSLIDYLARTYGKDKLVVMLEAVVKQGHRDQTFKRIFGRSLEELWTDWREELKTIYQAGADLPPFTGENEALFPDYQSQYAVKTGPGGEVFFLSTHLGRIYDLYMADGTQVRKLTEQTVLDYDLAPDGRELVFLSDEEGERRLYRLDLTSGVVVPIAAEITNPIEVAWSPQGDCLVVAANLKGDTDLFLLTPDGRLLEVVADSEEDETAPAWKADGQQLVYVASKGSYDQLYLWDGETTRQLTGGNEHHRSPVWDGDGKLYCLTGEHGYYRPAAVDPATGTVTTFWPYRESVLELAPAEDGFFLILYNDKRAEIYRFQP
ncbi:MAG TPA: basic secretory protein-like protein [Capillibacterium sp.]